MSPLYLKVPTATISKSNACWLWVALALLGAVSGWAVDHFNIQPSPFSQAMFKDFFIGVLILGLLFMSLGFRKEIKEIVRPRKVRGPRYRMICFFFTLPSISFSQSVELRPPLFTC